MSPTFWERQGVDLICANHRHCWKWLSFFPWGQQEALDWVTFCRHVLIRSRTIYLDVGSKGQRQTCSKTIQTSRMVTSYNVWLHGDMRRALCELVRQLWVPGKPCMRGHPLLCFCPNNSAATHNFNALSMQVGKEFKEEEIVILLVWIGALEGGLGGWWWVREVQPQNYMCLPTPKIFSCLLFPSFFMPDL